MSLSLLQGRWLLVGDKLSLRCHDLDDGDFWDNRRPITQISVKVKYLGAQVVTNDEGLYWFIKWAIPCGLLLRLASASAPC